MRVEHDNPRDESIPVDAPREGDRAGDEPPGPVATQESDVAGERPGEAPDDAEAAELTEAPDEAEAREAQAPDEAEAPAAAEPEELAPGEVPVATVATIWEAEVVDGYRDRWQQLQLRFIDDPRQAAEQAQGLVTDVCQGLTNALDRHRNELDRWGTAQL